MENKHLNKLFNPKSIAVVGATDADGKVGRVVTENLLNLGFRGKVFLVNPGHEKIFERKCYPRVEDIGENVDLAIVIVPSEFVVEVINNASEKTKNFVIISAGFSETGKEGKKKEEQLLKISQEKNINILGPNCLGFINPRLNLNATFAGGMPSRGNIAFVSQSGALAVAIMDIFKKENLGFSEVVSIGNKMQIDESDLINYFGKDVNTKVIGIYLEGIKDGNKFIQSVMEVSKLKPVVILKAGKTEKSQKAISSHTGALAGSDEIITAVFKKCGIIKADDVGQFLDVLRLISFQNPPKSEMVSVVTNAGGVGVLSTDAFLGKNIKLAELSKIVKDKLKSVLPKESSVDNPVDVLGDAHEDRYRDALKIIGSEKNIGTILCLLTPQEQTPVGKIAQQIIAYKDRTEITLVAGFMGGERIGLAVNKLHENNIPNYIFPENAVAAIDHYWQWNKFRSKNSKKTEIHADAKRKKRFGEMLNQIRGDGRESLFFSEAHEIMEAYGINTVKFWTVGDNLKKVSFPAAIKVDSPRILHKTDKNALILNIQNEDELNHSIKAMEDNFPGEKLIIQPMLERKTELIMGIKNDEIFGPVVVAGLGGIYTEVFKTVEFFIPLSTRDEIEEKIRKGKLSFLFEKTRGQNSYNIREISGIVESLMNLASECPEIKELDINPLLAYNDSRKAMAVDVKIII